MFGFLIENCCLARCLLEMVLFVVREIVLGQHNNKFVM